MAQKKVSVEIQGISPLLMNRFPMEPIKAIEKKPKEEQAEIAAYRDDKKKLFIPAMNIHRALISAATYSKGKGRASLQKPVAACVMVGPDYVIMTPQKYVVDARPVVVPATKGRVVRYRPKFEDWGLKFDIEFDDELLKASELREVVDNCGRLVGLADFRPEKKGPFGRFSVTSWKA